MLIFRLPNRLFADLVLESFTSWRPHPHKIPNACAKGLSPLLLLQAHYRENSTSTHKRLVEGMSRKVSAGPNSALPSMLR